MNTVLNNLNNNLSKINNSFKRLNNINDQIKETNETNNNKFILKSKIVTDDPSYDETAAEETQGGYILSNTGDKLITLDIDGILYGQIVFNTCEDFEQDNNTVLIIEYAGNVFKSVKDSLEELTEEIIINNDGMKKQIDSDGTITAVYIHPIKNYNTITATYEDKQQIIIFKNYAGMIPTVETVFRMIMAYK